MPFILSTSCFSLIFIRYPPGLKNRDFTPVGAFNTWGNLLGFAHWLMNMAIYTNYYQVKE